MADIVSMPKLGFDMAEGTLVNWVVSEGESIVKGAVLAEIETDKATVEVESNYEGIVARHLVQEGEIVPVNAPIAVIAAPGEAVDYEVLLGESGISTDLDAGIKSAEQDSLALVIEVSHAVPDTASTLGDQFPLGVRASPLARRMATEKGIDLRSVKGSGPGGRIVKKDIETLPEIPSATPPRVSIPQDFPTPDTRAIPLSRLRATIGRRMVEAVRQVPHFYITHEYDMQALMDLRKEVNTFFPEDGKISINDFIVKAVALALREFPNLNATIDEKQGAILQYGSVNIGVAVAVENGLLTVVSRNTDHKPLRQIAVEIRDMVGRAREGKVRPEDIEGSTFSVSNLGMYDVEHFTAIINPPEAAILAVGSVRTIPVVVNGEVRPGQRMKATLSVDHRVSDGVEGAKFMQFLAHYLEKPLSLLV